MNYGELKNEIRDLGFEENQIFNEYPDIFRSAITRACKLIATLVQAPIGKIDLDLTNEANRSADGRYDLEELSKDEYNNVRFDSIERVVQNTDSGVETFLDYDIVQYKILVLDPSTADNLTIYYKERIVPITSSTLNEYQIQVVYPCEPLVALLAAHYVWLDDDERKAVMYWNEFDQLRQEIEAKAFRLKARVVGGYPWLK